MDGKAPGPKVMSLTSGILRLSPESPPVQRRWTCILRTWAVLEHGRKVPRFKPRDSDSVTSGVLRSSTESLRSSTVVYGHLRSFPESLPVQSGRRRSMTESPPVQTGRTMTCIGSPIDRSTYHHAMQKALHIDLSMDLLGRRLSNTCLNWLVRRKVPRSKTPQEKSSKEQILRTRA